MSCLARPVFRLEDQPDFVQRPEVAAPYDDEGPVNRRRLPCICPEQHKGAKGRTLAHSTAQGRLREAVACERCPRRWTRVTA